MKQYKAKPRVSRTRPRISKNRQTGRGSVPADPALNPDYCDQHVTQCKDFYSTCQQGGVERRSSKKNRTRRSSKNNNNKNKNKNKNNNRKYSGGGIINASLNSGYCDSNSSQCLDTFGGGSDINNLSDQQAYQQYKTYKRLYKQLKNQQ